MKIKTAAKYGNGCYDIQLIAHRNKGTTAVQVFKALYKTSKQPLKKINGIKKRLAYMVRHGWLRQTGDVFHSTASGVIAAKSLKAWQSPKDQEPVPFMRLAK